MRNGVKEEDGVLLGRGEREKGTVVKRRPSSETGKGKG